MRFSYVLNYYHGQSSWDRAADSLEEPWMLETLATNGILADSSSKRVLNDNTVE